MRPVFQVLEEAVQAAMPGTEIEWTLREQQYVLQVQPVHGASFIHVLPGWLEDCNLPSESPRAEERFMAIVVEPLIARLRNMPVHPTSSSTPTVKPSPRRRARHKNQESE